MSEMADRVADALAAYLWETHGTILSPDTRGLARAAIEAMRDPPHELRIIAVENEHWFINRWNALIDAALATPPEPQDAETK